MDTAEKILLSIHDTCNRTGLSRTRIYEELSAGRLQSLKVGRRRLVPRAAIDEWIHNLLKVSRQ
jgi:excisionase family DNA binding protein